MFNGDELGVDVIGEVELVQWWTLKLPTTVSPITSLTNASPAEFSNKVSRNLLPWSQKNNLPSQVHRTRLLWRYNFFI